jgi:hypothetical protein
MTLFTPKKKKMKETIAYQCHYCSTPVWVVDYVEFPERNSLFFCDYKDAVMPYKVLINLEDREDRVEIINICSKWCFDRMSWDFVDKAKQYSCFDNEFFQECCDIVLDNDTKGQLHYFKEDHIWKFDLDAEA